MCIICIKFDIYSIIIMQNVYSDNKDINVAFLNCLHIIVLLFPMDVKLMFLIKHKLYHMELFCMCLALAVQYLNK